MISVQFGGCLGKSVQVINHRCLFFAPHCKQTKGGNPKGKTSTFALTSEFDFTVRSSFIIR